MAKKTAQKASKQPYSGDLEQICMNCDYWLPFKHLALTTDTVGSCYAMGSPYDNPSAGQSCRKWDPVSNLPSAQAGRPRAVSCDSGRAV